MKQHDKGAGNGNTPKPKAVEKPSSAVPQSDNLVVGGQDSSGRRRTSKYFADKEKKEVEGLPEKRKSETADLRASPAKKVNKNKNEDDEDFVLSTTKKVSADVTPSKKLKSGSGRAVAKKSEELDESGEDDIKEMKSNSKASERGRGGRTGKTAPGGRKKMVIDDESDEDEPDDKTSQSVKPGGRGRGGRGSSTASTGGRGRGSGGRGGFMNFGERKDPPHKGEKEIPEGASDCLAGFTFVISGTLDSLEREEAEDLIKRHGGRVTGSVSKKTNFLLCDEDIEGQKSRKAKELGTAFLTEDGLLDMIRKSNKSNTTKSEELKKPVDKVLPSPKKTYPSSAAKNQVGGLPSKSTVAKGSGTGITSAKTKSQATEQSLLPWTEKYRPKVPNDIVGNQSLVKQLHDWLLNWNDQFLNSGSKSKGKKQNDSGAKKAVLLSGTPGIGKTTSAKLVSQMLGFKAVEVNASDNRGKADSKIEKGIGGSTANSIQVLVTNEAISNKIDRSEHQKTVLIMDEVDGISAGDRGGVSDLIANIKTSKIPIICICNDRYSQKLKSLVNHCLLLSFRKPTKQQMAKRLLHIANAEGLQVNEIALEELAERVNGDMRMALNQLQYMSLSMSVIKYDDIRQRLQGSSKDEDISPFTAVDKLFGFNSGKLRMDERIDLSMSDPDLVPLLIQENYINYRPSSVGKDDNGLKRMSSIARAAESIADGDIFNVQIRRYRQWQLSQSSVLSSCIIPAALLHGQRETLEQGERNFNRFGGWLGKNSTMGKNYRLLEDMHVHLLASRDSYLGRSNLRLDYFTPLVKHLTEPLRVLPKDEAVEKVVEFMDSYSISQEDFDTAVELSKFKGRPTPMDGIQPAVKAALTKAYNKGSSSRVIRTADMVTLPGVKKVLRKRVAAMLEPVEESLAEDNGEPLEENENSDAEDLEDRETAEEKLQSDLADLKLKGIEVQVDLKGSGSSSAGKASSGRGRGRSRGSSDSAEKKVGGGRGSGSASKRKR
ncbi:OLC1v1004852C1 [Oldenlandia corymbosa var. corymbosa]|uniref:Replication factor C subunit 1 n=1 Tax=Oldenlandia corymbosa var. corymbosa TaxID=529605 RepID=A0AAV1DDA6_OLDCO|nr:OLC1v1004852C1 [Oldenlandia corymbosa var. corymbosa]